MDMRYLEWMGKFIFEDENEEDEENSTKEARLVYLIVDQGARVDLVGCVKNKHTMISLNIHRLGCGTDYV
jgi:hypothetical protein